MRARDSQILAGAVEWAELISSDQTCEKLLCLVLFLPMPGTLETNPIYDDFRTILGQKEEFFRPWSGVIFRSVSPKYARPDDLLSGYGSFCAGGRWNAPGIYAIYGSLEPGLAADESFDFLLQHFGWQNRDIPHAWLSEFDPL